MDKSHLFKVENGKLCLGMRSHTHFLIHVFIQSTVFWGSTLSGLRGGCEDSYMIFLLKLPSPVGMEGR